KVIVGILLVFRGREFHVLHIIHRVVLPLGGFGQDLELPLVGTGIKDKSPFRIEIKTDGIWSYLVIGLNENGFLGVGPCGIGDPVGVDLLFFIVENNEPGLDIDVSVVDLSFVIEVHSSILWTQPHIVGGGIGNLVGKELIFGFDGIILNSISNNNRDGRLYLEGVGKGDRRFRFWRNRHTLPGGYFLSCH